MTLALLFPGLTMGAVGAADVTLDPLGFLVRVPSRGFQAEVRARTLNMFTPKRTFQVEVKPGGRRTP